MASLMSVEPVHSGSCRRRSVQTRTGAAAPVKQLLTKLRSSLTRSAARPRRAAALTFAYDLQSYSQNFDDGIASLRPPIVAS
ncbi:hypothetical protein PR202_gb08235 [Eleusine coracana subsp. coracana]|uniref:Uncharacterized protein n=1 Tax=Eleusine coracana subsp. coracana TaxID=191504 RepID=A0AAV5EE37_ELECO|nr:hypothetical protein PR202_gb08235 [Eleusine coracana subsp. coracana]